jgi:hypothetical protein
MPPSESAPEVLLFVIDAGGGHRAAANALVAAAAEVGAPFRPRLSNLQDVLAPLDFTRRLTGIPMEQAYNAMVRRGMTLFLAPMLRAFQAFLRLRRRAISERLVDYLRHERPAAVVSLMPNFNAPIRDAVRKAHPHVPFLVLLTDLADFPPGFWIEPGVDRVIVGSEHAAGQARQLGVPHAGISQVSGMVLHPRFYPRRGPVEREGVRRELGIDGASFVVLVLFGGKGSPEMKPLCAALLEGSHDWRVIAICGDNPSLFESLSESERRWPGRLHRLGFTDRVADYMAASDLLVTKPGPGSLAEALHQRLPVVVTCNRRAIPQERYNAGFIEEKGLGLVVSSWRRIPDSVARLATEPGLLERCRTGIAALPENRAVYEALQVIGGEVVDGPA